MILLKDILTFLGLDYRDASLLILYLVVIGISIQKNQMNRIILTYKNFNKKCNKTNYCVISFQFS